MGHTITFTAELWLHRDAEENKPVAYDLFNIGGYKIPADLITYMQDNARESEWLARSGVPMEKVLRVQGTAWYDSGDFGEGGYSPYWDLTCLSWIVVTPSYER